MSEFPKKAEDRMNSAAIALVGIVSAIMIWATVVALLAYYKNTNGALFEIREAEGNNAAVNSMKAQQSAQLKELKYLDPQKGTLARLPIDRAKALVVAAAKANKPSFVPSIGAHDVPSVPAKAGKPIEVVPGAPTPDAPVEGAEPAKESSQPPKALEKREFRPDLPEKRIKIKPASKVKKAVKKTLDKPIPKTEDIIKKGVKKATGNL